MNDSPFLMRVLTPTPFAIHEPVAGTTVKRASHCIIRWETFPQFDIPKVVLLLFRFLKPQEEALGILELVPNTGIFTLHIPTDVEPGEHLIRVYSALNLAASATSGPFSIE